MIIAVSRVVWAAGWRPGNLRLRYYRQGRNVTEPKTPLDELALDGLMLASDAAVVSYQEQRLKLQATRKVRDNRQRADLAPTQTGGDDEVV